MPLINAALAALSRLIGSRAGQWIVSIGLWLGIGVAAHTFAVAPLLAKVQGYFSALPVQVVAWLGVMKLDKFFTMVFSAYASAAALGRLKLVRRSG